MNPVRRGAAVLQRYVVTLFFLGVVVQFFLVGYGLFGMKHGATIDDAHSLNAHRDFGFILSDFGALLILVTTLVAWQRPLGRKVGAYVVLAVLAFVQSVLATVGWHHKYVGMFHPVNALILFGLSGSLAFTAWREARADEPVAVTAA